MSSLHILEISPLCDVGLVKIFSHSVGCLFVLLTVSFALKKLISVIRNFFVCLFVCLFIYLFIFALSIYATGVMFRKWSLVLMHWRLLPTFSSIRFSVVGFILKSLIHLNLSFVHGDRYGTISILLHVDIQFCVHHLLKMLSFFHFIILASFFKNGLFIDIWINIWIFDLIPLVNLSVFMTIPSCFHYCSSLIELDVRDGDASRSSFIVQDWFWLSCFFFHMKLTIVLSRSVKNCVGFRWGLPNL